MSESREPREASEPNDRNLYLDLYWADCHHRSASPTAMLVSLERLIQAELGLNASESDRLSEVLDVSGTLPTYEQFEEAPREARELFGLAPLRFLGPYIEMTHNLPDMKQWYEKAIDIATKLSPGYTNETCFDINKKTPEECEKSRLCPRKAIKAILVNPVRDHDFGNDTYKIDPVAHEKLIVAKLELAVKSDLITEIESLTLRRLRNLSRGKYMQRPKRTE